VKRVLIVSPYFPPATLAGVHRARHLAKHLSDFGWEPIILRVRDEDYTERLDPELGALVPTAVKQILTGAVPPKLARAFGVGDLGLRAFYHLKRAIELELGHASVRPDVVLITGSPYYPMLLTSWIKKSFDVPVVLDFQDPWVSQEGELRPKLSKGGISHLLAKSLEPLALRHASFVTSVSDRQNEEMADRYIWLDRTLMGAIPIGGDPDDFTALRSNPPQNPTVRLNKDKVNLSYVGTFLPKAGPLMLTLFKALAQLRDKAPALANRLQLNFVGTSNQPNGGGTHLVGPIANSAGVGDLVHETPQRVPFLEALHLLANSNGLMLIGSDEPHYTASKIYPALMSATAFLSIFHVASSAHKVLSEAGGGYCHAFSGVDELSRLESVIAQDLERFASGQVHIAPPNPSAYQAFTAKHVAGNFAEIFQRVAS
jgi:hypothetical protein